MEKKLHTITITIYNRDAVYKQVSDLLHDYAEYILLRTGYPIKEKNIAIIFLIVEMTGDELGALSGKLVSSSRTVPFTIFICAASAKEIKIFNARIFTSDFIIDS